MTPARQPVIGNIATGVPGMDAVLGGGLCEYSFNLIAGPPGAGKTTLVQQILFAKATPERPRALLHGARQTHRENDGGTSNQFSFFDRAKWPSALPVREPGGRKR